MNSGNRIHPIARTVCRASLLATVVVAVGVITGCRSIPKGVEPVSGFEPDRYLGEWHEIARLDHFFERNMTHVTARYWRRPDGKIGVLNRGYDSKRGKWSEVEGVARFRGEDDVAALSVTFQWPISGAYNVFELDEEGYQWAVVCGPSRGYLWILARESELPEDVRQRLVNAASERGFAVDELIWVEHQNPPPD